MIYYFYLCDNFLRYILKTYLNELLLYLFKVVYSSGFIYYFSYEKKKLNLFKTYFNRCANLVPLFMVSKNRN